MERAESALVIFVLKFVTVGGFYRESSQGGEGVGKDTLQGLSQGDEGKGLDKLINEIKMDFWPYLVCFFKA